MSDNSDRRHGAQPGQIGKIRWRDILTKGLPDGKVLVSDGRGGIRIVSASEIVGATQLDELSDVGSAPETAGFLLSADGSKYDGKTPDAAGLVDKTTAQTILGAKAFQDGIKVDTIDSLGGPVLAVIKRLSIVPAVNLDEAVTLGQALGVATAVVTVGHPDGIRTPDFADLGEAIENVTIKGGGIIIILDNNNYEATSIDGNIRDLRNITIVGQPGAEPAHMPFIHLQAPVDTVEQSSSSSEQLLPTESTQWRVVGCRLSRKALELEPTSPDINFGLLIEECAFTNQDPFGISVGGDEGAIEIFNSNANVIIKHCYVEADFRLNSSAWLVLASSNTVKIRFSGLRPNFTSELSPASIQVLKLTTGDAEIFHDSSITPVSDVSSTLAQLRTDAQPVEVGIRRLRVEINDIALSNLIVIDTGLRLTAFDVNPIVSDAKIKKRIGLVVDPFQITIDPSTNGVDGLDTGSLAANLMYFYFIIGDSRGISSVAGLLSLSQNSPLLPTGYDVFRRIGAIRANGAIILLPAVNQDGFTRYTNEASFSTADPGTTWADFDVSFTIPPTSRRGLFSAKSVISTPGLDTEIKAADSDLITVGSGNSGGVPVHNNGGSTGAGHADQNTSEFFMDVTSAQHVALVRLLGVANSYLFEVRGYVEQL